MTAETIEEKNYIFDLFKRIDGGTGFIHEEFDVNDFSKFTQDWFSLANAIFCEFIMDYVASKHTKN